MDFSYYDNKNLKRTLNIQVGANWSEIKTDNDVLNSIFSKIDDGDGVVADIEFSMLKNLFKMADNFIKKTAGNNMVETKELEELQKGLENGTINVNDVCSETIKNIDMNDYNLESLRKRFPEERYDIEYYEDLVSVYDRECDDYVLEFNIKDKKITSYFDYLNRYSRIYEGDKMTKYCSRDGYHNPEIEEIGLALYNQIYQKNAMGLPKTASELDEIISKINPDNIIVILREYSKLAGKDADLMTDLVTEFGIDKDKRNEYITHIKNSLIEYYKKIGCSYVDDVSAEIDNELDYQKNRLGFANTNYINVIKEKVIQRMMVFNEEVANVAPNGKIDATYKQGVTEDCWLLASIIAISNTPKGKEILDDTVSVNEDGSVTVSLKGVKKTYTISKEELAGNYQLATGDLDVRAIEIAVNKYFYEERGVRDRLDINGNWQFVAYDILTGKGDFNHLFPFGSYGDKLINPEYYCHHNFSDEEIDGFNSENKVITVAAYERNDVILASDASEQVLRQEHAYAVIRSDSEYVYLVNPWNSGSEIKITREQFKEFFNQLNEMEL